MLDHDHRDAARTERADDRHDVANLGRVQSGQHLVKQKELRRGRERPGQFQALAAGHREGVRRPIEQIAETDLASDRLGNADRVGARGVTQIRADQNVVAHRNAAERLHDLEGPGDAAPRQAMRRLTGRRPRCRSGYARNSA